MCGGKFRNFSRFRTGFFRSRSRSFSHSPALARWAASLWLYRPNWAHLRTRRQVPLRNMTAPSPNIQQHGWRDVMSVMLRSLVSLRPPRSDQATPCVRRVCGQFRPRTEWAMQRRREEKAGWQWGGVAQVCLVVVFSLVLWSLHSSNTTSREDWKQLTDWLDKEGLIQYKNTFRDAGNLQLITISLQYPLLNAVMPVHWGPIIGGYS